MANLAVSNLDLEPESYKWRRMIHFGDIQYSMEQLHLGVVSEMDRLASKVEIWIFSYWF